MAAPSRHLDCAATLWKSLIYFPDSVARHLEYSTSNTFLLETVQGLNTRRRERGFKGVQPSFSRTWTNYCSSRSLPSCCFGGRQSSSRQHPQSDRHDTIQINSILHKDYLDILLGAIYATTLSLEHGLYMYHVWNSSMDNKPKCESLTF